MFVHEHVPQERQEQAQSGHLWPLVPPLLHTAVQDLKGCKLPEPLVHLSKVLECNFEWTEKGEMPFEVLDQLLVKHEIDITGFNMSRTHRGNLYRSYVLYHGKSAAPPKG